MWKRRALLTIPAVAAAVVIPASTASAAPASSDAGCVAVVTSAFGPPGLGGPAGGELVSTVARSPRSDCFGAFGL